MKALVKQNKPILRKCHRREHIDFAISYKKCTLKDCKKVVWSYEIKDKISSSLPEYIFHEI